MNSDDNMDVIINSLGITFILEIDGLFWNACMSYIKKE